MSYYFHLRKSKPLAKLLREMYPEGVELTAERLITIWDTWGLKEDYSAAIQAFVAREVIKKAPHPAA